MSLIKRYTFVCLLLASIFAFAGCRRDTADLKYGNTGVKKIGVVLSDPAKIEVGANNAVTAGVKKAAADLDVDYKILAPKDLVNNEESLRFLAENNFDMVVAVGQGMIDDLSKVAPDYPDIKFVMFDGDVEKPNVTNVMIQEEDGAFLAGVEAASLSKSNLVGYLGDPITMDRSMENGFVRGVQFVNMSEGRQVKVNVTYNGITDKPAKMVELAKTAANNLYLSGVDVIFSPNANIGRGAAESAADNKRIVIGSDLTLMNTSPWTVYGAMVKKQDTAIYDLAKKIITGNFSGGRLGYGLAQGAVDFIPGQAVPVEIANKVSGIKDQVKKGIIKPYTIKIPQDIIVKPVVNQQPGNGSATGSQGKNSQGNAGRGNSWQSGGSQGGMSPGGSSKGGSSKGGSSQGGSSQGQSGNYQQNGIIIRKVGQPTSGQQGTGQRGTGIQRSTGVSNGGTVNGGGTGSGGGTGTNGTSGSGGSGGQSWGNGISGQGNG